MTRKGFLSTLGLAIASIAVAPAISLLSEEKAICKSVVLPLGRYELTSIGFISQMSNTEFDELVDIINHSDMPPCEPMHLTARKESKAAFEKMFKIKIQQS